MNITAGERRKTLGLLNVSEAARHLGVDVFRLHREIKSGRVPKPKVHLGRRMYFSTSELDELRKALTEMEGESECT